MIGFLRSILTGWGGAISFRSLVREKKRIVFYSEGNHISPHLEPLISELAVRSIEVAVLCSSDTDPLLNHDSEFVTGFFIGSGVGRSWTFNNLEASVFVTSTPDLDTLELKRSLNVDNYVYVQHSMISTHMGYRPTAFDNFDTVLCTGQYQIDEIRARERTENLPQKQVLAHGYCRLDAIAQSADDTKIEHNKTILVAPTWGDNSILGTCGLEVVRSLLNSGFQVVFRPHPESLRKQQHLLSQIAQEFDENEHFEFDLDPSSADSMHQSEIMISDWSGVAIEYAYGLEKPVIFVDVPKKINNPSYHKLDLVPMEISVRDDIGIVLPLNELERLPDVVANLLRHKTDVNSKIKSSRSRNVFNYGSSAQIGADSLERLAGVISTA